MLIIPENTVAEFKKKLVLFYESGEDADILDFMLTHCIKTYQGAE